MTPETVTQPQPGVTAAMEAGRDKEQGAQPCATPLLPSAASGWPAEATPCDQSFAQWPWETKTLGPYGSLPALPQEICTVQYYYWAGKPGTLGRHHPWAL